MRALFLLLVSLLVAACGEMPQPFRHEGLNPSVAPPGPRAVLVRPPDESAAAQAVAAAVVKRLADQDIPASVKSSAPGSWVLASSAETLGASRRLVWRLISPEGEAPAEFAQILPAAQWEALGRAGVERMADEIVARYLPALHHEPTAVATEAAPPPRVPTLRIERISGLPGDGDTALTKALAGILRRMGVKLTEGEADAVVGLRFSLVPGRPGEDMLDLTWVVKDGRSGAELGKAAQQGALPKGRLASAWGALAGDIAAGGAEGIADIMAAMPQK